LRQQLDTSEADRAARLEVIHQQQAEMAELRQHLDASEADRAARLEVIHQQQAEMDRLRSVSGFLRYRFSKVKKAFLNMQK